MGRRPSTIYVTISELMREPGTCPELARRMGCKRRDALTRQFLSLRAEGVIYVQGWRRPGRAGVWSKVWAMQRAPFELPDAPKPATKPAYTPRRKPRQVEAGPDVSPRLVIDAARGITRHHCL